MRAKAEALSDTVKTIAEEAKLIKPLDTRMWDLYKQITLSPPLSLKSAAIKLRLLADSDIGLENSEGIGDLDSLRQILALIEGAAVPIGTGSASSPAKQRTLLPDRLAANASKALALRMLMRYGDARDQVEFYDGDVSDLPAAPSPMDIEKRYSEQMREIVSESPETASAEFRYLGLLEQIVVDQLSPPEEAIMPDEDDWSYGLQLVQLLRACANDRDVAAGIARERAERKQAGGDNAA